MGAVTWPQRRAVNARPPSDAARPARGIDRVARVEALLQLWESSCASDERSRQMSEEDTRPRACARRRRGARTWRSAALGPDAHRFPHVGPGRVPAPLDVRGRPDVSQAPHRPPDGGRASPRRRGCRARSQRRGAAAPAAQNPRLAVEPPGEAAERDCEQEQGREDGDEVAHGPAPVSLAATRAATRCAGHGRVESVTAAPPWPAPRTRGASRPRST